jgi:SAM-dependent methyltransferase
MGSVDIFSSHSDRYDNWFALHEDLYEAELSLLRQALPPFYRGIEIGVGTGRFAAPLGITMGLEPSETMAEKARERGISVIPGVAEILPFEDKSFDLVLMVTTICFVDNPLQALRESFRILQKEGNILIAFVPKESTLGMRYEENRQKSLFYQKAQFFSSQGIKDLLTHTGFRSPISFQTLMGENLETQILPGDDKGSFVCIRATKS